MQAIPKVICDRCGCDRSYIQFKGTNGMVAYTWDLCHECFVEIKAMMLNANNRFMKPFHDKDE